MHYLTVSLVAAAYSIAVLCGIILSWRHAGGQICIVDGKVSTQAVYVWLPTSSFWEVSCQLSICSSNKIQLVDCFGIGHTAEA